MAFSSLINRFNILGHVDFKRNTFRVHILSLIKQYQIVWLAIENFLKEIILFTIILDES